MEKFSMVQSGPNYEFFGHADVALSAGLSAAF